MSSDHKENHPPESPLKPPYSQDTDDEQSRGRKRRRSSANSPPALHTSIGNNFRGRGRQRSLSVVSSNAQSAAPSPKVRSQSPPGRKYQKKDVLRPAEKKERKGKAAEKKRCQSPSRSRSRGVIGTPLRRRHRTRTRSRSHNGMKKANTKDEAGFIGVEVDLETEGLSSN